ncbi:MAG: hypothetical protein R3F20_13455 [Planctomycetota bacterium]
MTPATGCLHCHGPRPDGAARRWVCLRCGRTNSQALSGIDWSRHPRLVRRERILILFFWVYPAIAWALAPGGASEEIAPTLWVFGIAPAFLAHGARQRRRHWLPLVATFLGLLVLVAMNAEAFAPPDAPTVFLLLPWLLGIAAAVSLWAATARGEVHVLAETHSFTRVDPGARFPPDSTSSPRFRATASTASRTT